MTEQPAEDQSGSLFMSQEVNDMRQIDDYIPIELWHESNNFLKDMSDNIEIYKKIKSFGSVRQNEEADKFVAWWEFK